MNFWHGLDEFEFETHQLIGTRIHPRAAFERDRVIISCDHICVNAAGTVRPLLKMDLPRGTTRNLAHTLTNEIEVGTHLGMKNESHGRQTHRGDRGRKLRRIEVAIAVLVQLDQPARKLLHRHYIFEGAKLRRAQLSLLVYREMVHAFGSAEFFKTRH